MVHVQFNTSIYPLHWSKPDFPVVANHMSIFREKYVDDVRIESRKQVVICCVVTAVFMTCHFTLSKFTRRCTSGVVVVGFNTSLILFLVSLHKVH